MTVGAVGTDPTMRLAFLELNQDSTEEKTETAAISSARKQAEAAQQDEVEKMHAGAHDLRIGAVVGASLSVGAAAASTAGALSGPANNTLKASTFSNVANGSGAALKGLAAPFADYAGAAPKADHDADAAAARGAAQRAQLNADDATHTRDKLEKHDDRTISTLAQLLSGQRDATRGLIGNVR